MNRATAAGLLLIWGAFPGARFASPPLAPWGLAAFASPPLRWACLALALIYAAVTAGYLTATAV